MHGQFNDPYINLMSRNPAGVKMPETLQPIWNQTPISQGLARNFTGPVSTTALKHLYIIASKGRIHDVPPALLKVSHVQVKRNVGPMFN
jgi:hypothetical protein